MLRPCRKVAAPNGAQQKTHFAHPGTTANTILETNDTGHEQKGATTKKNTDSLTAALDRDAHSLLFRGDFSGRARAGVFFLLRPRADAHSLTAGLGGDASRRGGAFFCCGPTDQGGVFFFFCCGPARTLTHSLWAGAISARPGWCFCFCCGPAEPGEPITKNVWCTTSGLKRPGGATLHGEVLKTASGRRARSSCSPTWLGTPRVHSKPPACTA